MENWKQGRLSGTGIYYIERNAESSWRGVAEQLRVNLLSSLDSADSLMKDVSLPLAYGTLSFTNRSPFMRHSTPDQSTPTQL